MSKMGDTAEDPYDFNFMSSEDESKTITKVKYFALLAFIFSLILSYPTIHPIPTMP